MILTLTCMLCIFHCFYCLPHNMIYITSSSLLMNCLPCYLLWTVSNICNICTGNMLHVDKDLTGFIIPTHFTIYNVSEGFLLVHVMYHLPCYIVWCYLFLCVMYYQPCYVLCIVKCYVLSYIMYCYLLCIVKC